VHSQEEVESGAPNKLLNATVPQVQSLSAHGLRAVLANRAHQGVLLWFCVSWIERCAVGASKFVPIVKALLEHATDLPGRQIATLEVPCCQLMTLPPLPGMQIATFDTSVNDLPRHFNASGVRVWGNQNVPPEFSSLPMVGYHFWKYFHVPALFYLPPGSAQPRRFEGDLVYNRVKSFLVAANTQRQQPGGSGGAKEL
jgi:hypothetical protein